MSRTELAKELRELRKTTGQKSISKMKMVDIAQEIERLKLKTATTPSAGINGGTVKVNKKMVSKVDNIKEAKEAEFPTVPEKVKKSKGVNSASKKSESKVEVVKKVATVKKTEKVAPKKSKKVGVSEVVSESDTE